MHLITPIVALPAIIMRLLLLFIILIPFAVNGQDLTKVTQINLRYNLGHHNFGDTGHYAKEEVIQFIPISKTKFVRTYYLVTKRYVANPATGQNNLSINVSCPEIGCLKNN